MASTNEDAGPSSSQAASSSANTNKAQIPDLEGIANRLTNEKSDAQTKAAAAQEFKDILDMFHGANFAQYARHMLQASMKALASIPCSFQTDAPEQRTRLTILETLHRLPTLDPAKPIASHLMKMMVEVVRQDNEENAVVAIKVIIDLHRHLKTELEGEVQPFLQLVGDLYKNFKVTVAKSFESEASQMAAGAKQEAGTGAKTETEAPSPAADSQAASVTGSEMNTGLGTAQPKTLPKSFSSFKVLTECPIATVFILQTYKNNVPEWIPKFLPLTIEDCLTQQARPQKEAHEAAAEKGTFFVGVAPGIKNRALYTEMVVAQVKTMSFLAYVIKGSTGHMKPYATRVPDLAVRLLMDCPPEASATRKELLVAIRHIFTTDLRANFVGQINTLLDQRVLLGTGITTRETLRPLAISMLADLVHHVRNELTNEQIYLTVHRHCQMLHDPTLAPGIMTMCTKLLTNLVETIASRHQDGAQNLLRIIFDSLVEKLGGLPRLREDYEAARAHKRSPDGDKLDAVMIEKGKTVQVNVMVPDFGNEPFKDARFLFRNILMSIKSLLVKMKSIGAPEPDSEIMSRLFVHGVRSWSLYEQTDQLPDKEGMESFTNIFIDIEHQTFHEVFSTNMPFLFDRMLTSGMLLGIPQSLLSNEATSKRFVAILLRFLVDRLADLGSADKKHASVSLRLFKMAFMAVTIFPDANEVVLQPHLSHIIMTSMKFASRATEPANYFLLLRALFRSIGGGRFELLYKDVLPLLPVMLESLNHFLNAAEPSRRELFVDLCLTVPVRLSVLLPYLGYLMRPLVLALQSSTDLVSQGLRTLELCIDNLTQEFLDPIMAPYAYDIMSALWKHLQPLPHNHQHSHTTMRILGKMGGRNRKLLQAAPHLEYNPSPKEPSITIHLEGRPQTLALLPVTDLALENVRRSDAFNRKNSFELLRHASTIFLDSTLNNDNARERDGHFERVVKGLFDATRVEDLNEEATSFLKMVARQVITLEAKRDNTSRQFSQLTLSFFDGIVSALGGLENELSDLQAIIEIEYGFVGSFRDICNSASKPELFSALIHSLASKHCNLCYDQLWQRKTGGWMGIDMLVRRCDLGRIWMRDHQLEIVRALLYMLKDMPNEPPRNIDQVADTLMFVLRTVNTLPEGNAEEAESAEDKTMQDRQFSFLVGVLLSELSSSNSKVRGAARKSFELLAELKGINVTDILMPAKDRLLSPIFQKPLRALPFGMQIGHIDAITFCLQLRPPLPDFNEELFRVLTEALALAETDDQALIGRTSTSQYKNMVAVTQLRVVAIKLLASAMACPEFDALGSKHGQMRLRIISVYFKSLYSRSEVVIDQAYECLKETLHANPKLPKDVLQSGLRPILMTLADPSRLTMAGLDGLARVLELLTSYFKVEIGTKLLSHMQAIATPAIVERAGQGALDGPLYAETHQLLQPRQSRESEPIETLAAIVRVFHLLPPAANAFMDPLVAQVVQIEQMLKRSGPTPFTKPLAQFVDKNAKQGAELFFNHLEDASYVKCFRHLIGSDFAPNLREHITTEKAELLLPVLKSDADSTKSLAGLRIASEMEKKTKGWFKENKDVIEAILTLWQSEGMDEDRAKETGPRENRRSVIMSEILCEYIRQGGDVRAEYFFALTKAFTYPSSIDQTNILRTIYQELAINGSVSLKRDIIRSFVDVFEDENASQLYKAECLRILVNPILVATAKPGKEDKAGEDEQKNAKKDDKKSEKSTKDGDVDMKDADENGKPASEGKPDGEKDEPLFDFDLLNHIVRRIWKIFSAPKPPLHLCSDDLVRVELLHMSTMVLEHCADLLSGNHASAKGPDDSPRKDAIKFGWTNLTAEDVTVKNSAYIFIARFLELFESPIKIVTQIFLGLLRSQQPEGRAMVRKALDILVPALPKRMPTEPGKIPDWAKATKRQLVQEGHNLAQLYNILQLIIRHADLFYPSRELFLPHIASSLAKLGLSQTSNPETRHLAVEAVDVVFNWEKKRSAFLKEKEEAEEQNPAQTSAGRKRGEDGEEGSTTRKRARIDKSGTASSTASPAVTSVAFNPSDHEYSTPLNVREAVLGFLLRFVSLSTESASRGGTVNKAFILLKEVISTSGWQEIPIKLAIFQRPLTAMEIKEQTLGIVTNSLQTLKLVIKDKSEAWILAHLPQIHKLMEKSMQSDEPAVLESCKGILDKVFEVLPPPPAPVESADNEEDAEGEDDDQTMADQATVTKPTPAQPADEASAFRAFAENIITEGLKNSSNAYAALVTLTSWSKATPEVIDQHLAAITKVLTKLTKDHITATAPVSISDPSLKMLIMDLDLLKSRISHLGEQRRWFLSAVVQLVERTNTVELCRYLLSMMSKWILEQKEAFPTIKEKAGILIKMMSYETRDEQLLRDYLDLIHSIYIEPAYSRTELTVRLENAFLLGLRNSDPTVRQKFVDIFDRTLVRGLPGRMQYLLGTQNWEFLAEHYWIQQALDLLLGSIDGDRPLLGPHPGLIISTRLGDLEFAHTARGLTVGAFIKALRAMLYVDPEKTHLIWISFFRSAWRAIPRKFQEDIGRALIGILTRQSNLLQAAQRPNVVQTLLQGALVCQPQVELPPHVVKYLGKTFNAWYTSMELLQNMLATLPREDDSIREATQDALAETYAELSEEDMFYGLWRRRVVFAESNAAISYEQNGMWMQAQVMYETAQIKARTGAITFTDAEYSLWEDHWVLCAQKLQQWDILTDLAKLEGNNDLLLECAWRLSDWASEREILEQALDSLSATSTPRRRVFAAYMALLKSQMGQDRPTEFGRICDEAIQLTLRKWHSLPSIVTQAHVPLLHIFQQFVELQEASTVFGSLAITNATNLDQRSTELKTLMQTWRERLPNLWDDINAWSDLVAWRQHVFGAVNKAYLPLVGMQQQAGANNSTNSYAYRGYHETAWIINRFAHVARKHYLNNVCIDSLTKIYQLPNIEIQEAFLKLREQAKCHYQNPNELGAGLEVINNTNLMFFAAPQKAEFFTLKGMFMARLGLSDEANRAFATAIQMDLNLAKAWTEWGRFNDRIFRDKPTEIVSASSAVSCYLQAAGLYKNSKTRKVLIRVLWLLGCDDSTGAISQAFDNFRGESPTWYWITYIPQLLQCLSQKEARFARKLLIDIAKIFPQSLYFHLRTTREELLGQKRSTILAAQRAAAARQQAMQKQQQLAKEQAEKKAAEEGGEKEKSADKPEVDGQGTAEKNGEADGDKKESDTAEKKADDAQGDTEMKEAETDAKVKEEKKTEDEKNKDESSVEKEVVGDAEEAKEGADASKEGGEATTSSSTDQPEKAASTAASAPSNATATSAQSVPSQPAASAPANASSMQPQPAVTSAPAPSTNTPTPAPQQAQAGQQQNGGTPSATGQGVRQPWEYVDDILNILKTAFPLLALTMENMAEQIQQRFKPTNDEDIYRLTNALLNDALQQYIQRATMLNDNGQLPQLSVANVARFADNLPTGSLKSSFEEDFVKSKPTLREYLHKLQRWRDRYEGLLDRRPARQHLEHCSHYLVEFQHQRFDEVEVPGQYLKLEDNNADFVKIARFHPTFDVVRSAGMCTRRLTMLSNKGSSHSFSVQLPSGRYCRREERIFILLRLLNRILERRVETRKRGLAFSSPATVPLSPQLRLIETNASIVSLQDIYERYCQEVGRGKEDAIISWVEKMRSTWASTGGRGGMVELSNLRMDLLDEISTKMIPETVLTSFLTRSMKTPSDLWVLRKHFTLQMAGNMFLTYVLFVSARLPNRIHISRSTGGVTMSDVVPTFHPTSPQFKSPDPTPFRLTPNIQHFIGPIGIEGILTSALVAIGRCLSEPERQLEEYLSIFVRDEIQWWLQSVHRQQEQQKQQAQAQAQAQAKAQAQAQSGSSAANLAAAAAGTAAATAAQQQQPNVPLEAPREIVMQNILEVVKRARLMSCKHEMDKAQPSTMPVSQTVIDLINSSSSPSKLALQDVSWMPFL